MNRIYHALVLLLIASSMNFVGCVSTKEYKRVEQNYEKLDEKYLALRNQYRRLSGEKAILEKDLKQSQLWREKLEKMLIDRNREVAQKNVFLKSCVAKLNRAELTNILECLANLDNCNISKDEMRQGKDILIAEQKVHLQRIQEQNKIIVKETEKKALYRGMLTIWENLSIEAFPRTEEHIFTNDHFLNLVVKVNDKPFFRHEFQTENEEKGFSRAFSAIMTLISIIPLLP